MKQPQTFETMTATYRTVGQLGAGGAGTVVEVEIDDGERFALKYLSSSTLSTEKVKRFRNELGFCQHEVHRNIIRVVDSGFILDGESKHPFYVMPLYRLTLRRLMNSGIEPEKVLPLFAQLLDAVEAAHLHGVWHRDLKPENILLDESCTDLVLTDFGVAHYAEPLLHTAVDTKDGDRLANFQYASPEQRARGRQVDRRADIYALGLILNEMFTGQIPHGTGYVGIGAKHSDYAYLDELIEKMLSQNPDDRPSTIDDVKTELRIRGSDFIAAQRLSEHKKKIISENEIDDPLVDSPPKISEVDWQDGELILTLNTGVNSPWADCFKNIGDYSCMVGYEPNKFQVTTMELRIECPEGAAMKLLDYAKDYVAKANKSYEQFVHRRLNEEKRKLEARVKEIEKNREVSDRLRKQLNSGN